MLDRRRLPLVLLVLALASSRAASAERDLDPPPALMHVRDVAPPPAAAAAAVPVDTIYVLGGPGTLSGKFQDAAGQPDWQGWTGVDLTQPTEDHWSVSTFGAANLDTTVADNHAWWCGDVFASCNPDDPPEGVGNNWYEILAWSGTVADPDPDCTVRVRAVVNVDTDPANDFLYLQRLSTGYPVELAYLTAQESGYQVDVAETLTPADYLGAGGDEVRLRWLFATDGAWSDEDCLWPTAGGCQIDRIAVTFDQGEGEQLVGEVETCEPGSVLQWVPTLAPGVGNFAQVWLQLDDLDPDAGNATPQVAFIDDGVVVPGTGGYPCLTWCYGPGGFIVNPEHGLSEPWQGIHNEVQSPVLVLPPGMSGGALLAFDLYVHGELDQGAPFLYPTWRVRSTADPAGLAGWSDWRSHDLALFGEPTYLRALHNVTDLLVPGATRVQVALGVRNRLGDGGLDGTPAPYFDNVAFLDHANAAPAVLHVRPDGTGDYATIQQAIFAAAPGDTVMLSDGVYTGDGNRDLNCLGKAVVVASASGDPGTCIVDCQGSEADRHRGFLVQGSGVSGPVLVGVTVRGGRAYQGAAVYLRNGGMTLERCIFRDNIAVGTSRMGGALYGDNATLVVRDCVFDGNEAERGGAIGAIGTSALAIDDCLFTANRVLSRGSGVYVQDDGTVNATGCTFVANRDLANLGVITVQGHGVAQITRTIVVFTAPGRSVYCAGYGTAEVACSDFYGNMDGDWTGCIDDQIGIDGNFAADPLFCPETATDERYALEAASPCAPAAQPECGLIGARPVGCDQSTGAPGPDGARVRASLHPAVPNPFNPQTRLVFDLTAAGPVRLAVHDLRGRLVRVLVNERLPAGHHEVVWDGRTTAGRVAASGTYVVRLVTGDGTADHRRVTLVR